METGTLKYNILDKIISIDDDLLLQKIDEIIGNSSPSSNPLKLSQAQEKMLMESELDIVKGNLLSDEEVNNEEALWLKE